MRRAVTVVALAAVAAFFVPLAAGCGSSDAAPASGAAPTTTVSWTPVAGTVGYQFLVDAKVLSSTNSTSVTSVKFATVNCTSPHTCSVRALGNLKQWDTSIGAPPVTTTTTTTTVPTTTTTPGSSQWLGTFSGSYLAAKPGTTVTVPCGTYPGQSITGQNTGTVAFVSATPGCVTISGELILGSSNSSASGNAPSHLSFDGINIVNGDLYAYYDAGTVPTDLTYRNAQIQDTLDPQGTNGGSLVRLNSMDGVLLSNMNIGPACCGTDGIDMTIPRDGAPSPNHIVVDHSTVHDIYDGCALLHAALPSTPCSGPTCDDSSCYHIDGMQWYGGLNSSVTNTTVTNINPAGNVGQGIFFQSANDGAFSNLTFTNDVLAPTPNNDFSISGPGANTVTGTVQLTGNTVHGKMLLYDDIFASPASITVTGNTADQWSAGSGAASCTLTLGDGSSYKPAYSGNKFANVTC